MLEQDLFKGTIKDFGGQDFMDLSKIRFIGQGPDATTATFTQTNGAGGLLQVAQGNHVADLHCRHVHDGRISIWGAMVFTAPRLSLFRMPRCRDTGS